MALIYRIYSLAFSFGLSFDDEPNLRILSSVVDVNSAMLYVFGGSAGPLGRPLSLLSFLVDLPNWPHEPAAFIRTNALLHQLNVLLVMWLSYLLAPHVPVPDRRRVAFAVLAALLWGASPILLSSSLMIVQRMNLLSASFVLLGLIGFLKGITWLDRSKCSRLMIAGGSLFVATAMGVLAKENAILLPAYALCIVICFLTAVREGKASVPLPTWWRATFLYAPLIFVLFYLARYWWLTDGVYPGRNFDVIQRLITESRILFRYLHMLLLPVRSGIGPYHDGYPISQDLMDPVTGLVSVVAWGAIVSAAILDRKNRFGLLRFAVLWFIAGHVLESTVVGLELYFEHRNYLPAVGIWIAVVGWALNSRVSPLWRGALILVLASAQFLVLFESARVWSDREMASAVWAHDSPRSQRAMMLRSSMLAEQGNIGGILELVQDVDPELEALPDFLFQRLDVYCSLLSEAEVRPVVENLKQLLRTAPAGHYSGIILTSISERVEAGSCRGVTREEVRQFFEAMSVPGVQFSYSLEGFAHRYLLDYSIGERNLDESMRHAHRLFEIAPSIETAELMVDMLLSAGLPNQAQELVPYFKQFVPRRPYVEAYWLAQIDRIEKKITSARTSRAAG